MKDAGSLALNRARWGLGQETLREPCGGNHTVTHSIKLINDILYVMRVGLPCGLLFGGVHGETEVLLWLQGPFWEQNMGCNDTLRSFCYDFVF